MNFCNISIIHISFSGRDESPFLVELVTQIEFVHSLEDCINEALSNSKVSIQFCNNILKMNYKVKKKNFRRDLHDITDKS